MLKYYADYLEKLATGALVVGLFQEAPGMIFLGLILSVIWFKLRREETEKRGAL